MKALVVGIPRSGSTLLCRMINSVENCICLSEPHLEALSLRTYRTLRDQKVSDLELEMFADHEMPLDVAMSKLEEIFEVAAFKETFRPEPTRSSALSVHHLRTSIRGSPRGGETGPMMSTYSLSHIGPFCNFVVMR
jgi:hypothetical protein